MTPPTTAAGAALPDDRGRVIGAPRTAPLTYHQERLWFIDAFERDRVYSGPPTYHNVPVWLWIDGRLDHTAIESALTALVARHEALRTTIVDGQQRIAPAGRVPLAVVEAPLQKDETVLERALQDSRRPFRIEQDSLARTWLYRISPARSLLAISTHHVVADFYSTRILVEDLVELYDSFFRAQASTVPAAPAFGSYAAWLRALPEGAFDPALAFWRWQLQAPLMPLELPYKHGRHRIHVFTPGVKTFEIGRDLADAAETLAKREGAALADVVLAVLAAVLQACSQQREIVLGTTHPNRDAGLERMVGPIANLLVLRFNVDDRKSFSALLTHVRRTAQQAAANRAIPFDRLVRELDIPKDMSRTALFDVLYQFVEQEQQMWQVHGASIARVDSFLGFGKYDLTVTARRADARLQLHVEYNRELFADAFIEDLVALLGAALRRVVDDPLAPLEYASRLPAALADRQMDLLRPQTGVTPAHETLDAAFDAVARRTPDRVAIVFEGVHITYRSIAGQARRIGRALLAAGVRPGSAVAVFLERSPEAIAAILGILRVGAAYVPIDPAYPPLRIDMMLEDSECSFVVTSGALTPPLQDELAVRGVRIVDLDAARRFAPAPLRSRSSADAVAYSIYTSGSTGPPKGCLVQHRNVVHLVLSQAAPFAFNADDVWTWCHSLCFDFSVWEIFGTLLYGARGVLLSEEAVRDPALVAGALAREQVTVLNQTPAAGYSLVQHLEGAESPRSLRWLVFGGDTLMPAQLRTWASENPRTVVVNMYGITETTVHVTRKELTAEDVASNSSSIGRAMSNAGAFVIDERFGLLPIGVRGEIAVTGDGVSLGYWKRPDLTAWRFVPDPFSRRDGARMYCSGDGGRVLPNGEIAFDGRRDQQVKVRGHRVELGEIERTLSDHPGVAETVVVLRTDAAENRAVVAFVRLEEGEAVAVEALRLFLKERLTPASIPNAIYIMDSLPRTPTGKLDRRALAALPLDNPDAKAIFVAPRNDRERALAKIWEEVLGRAPIGIRDDFFEIGGDSILSMQICARAVKAGIALTPKQLFEHATIEELSGHLGAAEPQAARAAGPARAPLLPAQAFFFAQHHPEPNHFNQSAWFELAAGIGRQEIEAALRALRAHRDALRLVFVHENGRTFQEARDVADDVPLIALPAAASDEERMQQEARAAEEAQRSLDIHSGPLFRCVFVEATAGRPARLLMVVHHLIVDTVSWRTLADDLDLLLDGGSEGGPLPVSPHAPSLLEYAAALAARQPPGGQLPAETAPPDGDLPRDTAAELDENMYEHSAEIQTELDESATRMIAGRLASDTLNWESALLIGVGQALLDWTGRDVVPLYFEAHGRVLAVGELDTSRTVGWFMKLHRLVIRRSDDSPSSRARPVRAELTRLKTSPDLLERAYLAMVDDPDTAAAVVPPGLCVNYLGQLDGLSRSAKRLRLVEGATGPPISPQNRRAQLIDVTAFILNGRLRVRWGYCARLHRRATIERLASACLRFVRSLAPGLAAHDETVPASRAPHVQMYSLAPGQLGMLYHVLLDRSGAPEYVVQSVLEIKGRLDVDCFRASWEYLLGRHDALRACFGWDGPEGPVQRFAERTALSCPVLDWRGLERSAVDERLDALVRDRQKKILTLAEPPLLSLEVVRTADEEHYALLRIHHLIVDGWSLAILRDELLRVYAALSRGAPVHLPRAGQFRDYLRYLEQQDTTAARSFWRRRLHGARASVFPSAAEGAASMRAVTESESVDVIDVPLPKGRGLTRWAARHRLTLNTIVQGVWSLVVGCLTNSTKVVTGVVVAGRPADLPDAESTVGAFINTLPLAIDAQPSAKLGSWLQALQSDFLESQRHAHCSLTQIRGWAGLPSDHPVFDTVLVCENYPTSPPLQLADVAIREVSYSLKESVPVILEYSISPRLICRLRYRPDLANASAVSDAAELFRIGVQEIDRGREPSAGQLAVVLANAAESARRARQSRFTAARRRALRDVAPGAARQETDAPARRRTKA